MPTPLSLHSAWAIAERADVPPQVAFYMGVHAALSAQLQAAALVDQGATDVLNILTDEVESFFELFGLSTAVPN
jgi:hypothetical protein